jgi:hypothetical protein
MFLDDTPQTELCAICGKPSRTRVHSGCRDRIAANLRALRRLYWQLADALQPGRRGGAGHDNAPAPD